MEPHNPYLSPQSAVTPQQAGNLAGRGERLGAVLIDGVMMIAIVMPVMYFGGYFDAVFQAAAAGGRVSILTQSLWGLVSFAIFIGVQCIPLKSNGQTWGKKALGVKIVTMTGERPGLGVLLGRRYLFSHGISLIPFVGGLAYFVNVLFIFRGDQRCLHDLVAGTQVVNAR